MSQWNEDKLTYEKMVDEYYANHSDMPPSVKAIYGVSSTNNFSNQYSAMLYNNLDMRSELFRALPKKTYLAEGDTTRSVRSLGGSVAYLTDLTDTFPACVEDVIDEIGPILPAPLVAARDESFQAYQRSLYNTRNNPAPTWEEKRQMAMDELINQFETDAHYDGTNAAAAPNVRIESIDRICTDTVEHGAAFWNESARSHRWAIAATGADVNAIYEANVNLPATAANREFDPEYLDDVLKDCKRYTRVEDRARFAIFTKGDTVEEIKKYFGDKEWARGIANVAYNLGEGLTTNTGDTPGFNVAGYSGGGLTNVPIITDDSCHYESGGVGNIYVLNLNNIEFRAALLPTWLETDMGKDMLLRGLAQRKGVAIMHGQIIAPRFNVHGAVKYLKAA
jgi:hypothetical protein